MRYSRMRAAPPVGLLTQTAQKSEVLSSVSTMLALRGCTCLRSPEGNTASPATTTKTCAVERHSESPYHDESL